MGTFTRWQHYIFVANILPNANANKNSIKIKNKNKNLRTDYENKNKNDKLITRIYNELI